MGGAVSGSGIMSGAAAREIAEAKRQMRLAQAMSRGLKAVDRVIEREAAKFTEPESQQAFRAKVTQAVIEGLGDSQNGG